MADLRHNAEAAHVFIKSLSKSLQALCNGCMEFNSGIEIGGYIYVTVDRGNKVDYVLNELVQKRDNNSMTFISNSYLSKKDRQIETCDGSCSPVNELKRHEEKTYKHSHAQYKQSSHFRSFNSPQISRSAKKRLWDDMKRSPSKHLSDEIPQSTSQVFQFDDPNNTVANFKTESFSVENKNKNASSTDNFKSKSRNKNYNNSSTGCTVDIKSDPDGTTVIDPIDIKCGSSEQRKNGNSFHMSATVNSQVSESGESSQSVNHPEGKKNLTSNLNNTSKYIPNMVDRPSCSDQMLDDLDMQSLPLQFNHSGLVNSELSDQLSYSGPSINRENFDIIEIHKEDEDMQAIFEDSQLQSSVSNSKCGAVGNVDTGNSYTCYVREGRTFFVDSGNISLAETGVGSNIDSEITQNNDSERHPDSGRTYMVDSDSGIIYL